jgi:hypothetical protein
MGRAGFWDPAGVEIDLLALRPRCTGHRPSVASPIQERWANDPKGTRVSR